jgi:hypothetical protein
MPCGYSFVYNPLTGRLDLVGTGSGGGGDVPPPPSSVLAKSIATTVPSAIKTTVVTFTAAADTFITAIYCSGMEYGKWYLVKNSTDEIIQRGGPDRDQAFTFPNPWKILSGDVIDVKVEHFVSGQTPNFEATIMGYI